MLKTILISLFLLIAALTMPANIYGQYGQQVLGEQAPEFVVVHKPVETGIEDHPEILGMILLASSLVFKVISKKTKVEYFN
ncbi:hypothetical protein A2W13_03845 [Candidatus Woesebacteria bacterium RBG_16_36_11]|uniref:Uncharacterized protein n=3 Tax=Candidatus Woeseibacteriota TaxID=1752722 RepID=A0A1F7X9W7_9BACT|nr:MAG: hypothetical protein A2Z67_00765 [Candidatus Woesebacteria bacterium RBG_13_36_22]OGM11812.1 MAG: hypothetical protein A2W13_03845 [Candidatus Woesebacteria bacterium RBG_16_36_11]OGM17569.1 MAG: hypothetical protein A2V55_00760 [Candidatus Woesebacteria bacterium RBG_19FT_COMBO_37_29]